ncbi:MAG: hypothetical protein UHE86_00800 [Acutalibacteraceae bacterium]|nr:hypothetical protein [Acutalibacteraceae bacterium]
MMKKIISLLLAILMLFSLCACKKDGEKANEEIKTIDSYAMNGEIPEIPVKLGTSIEDFKKVFPEDTGDADQDKVLLSEVAGETAVCLVTSNASFYYEKANEDKGIAVIAVTGGSVYGLKLLDVTTKSDITAKLEADFTEHVATEDEQYFLLGPAQNCTVLSATFDKIKLDFFLADGYLTAATITNTEYWTD